MFLVKNKFNQTFKTKTLFAQYEYNEKKINNSNDIIEALRNSNRLWLDEFSINTNNIKSIEVI